jgi:hypothetical protein
MSEEKIVEVVNEALAAAGVEDTVTAAGELEPRGHSGAGFAGGLIGSDIGDAIGSAAGGIAPVGGYMAARGRTTPPPACPSGWWWACRRRRSTDSRATALTQRLSSSACRAKGSRPRSTSA